MKKLKMARVKKKHLKKLEKQEIGIGKKIVLVEYGMIEDLKKIDQHREFVINNN